MCVLVFCCSGNGTTAAVELLIDCLGLKDACRDNNDNKNGGPSRRPVVFIGPYEHHSNLLPWRESGCEIVMVPECRRTHTVNLSELERLLQLSQYHNRLKMGTFTAASNVTGRVSDVDAIAATLHRHGALAFFDYATGAPYLDMNMNPPPPNNNSNDASLVAKDAIFLSPHKIMGGVGTPGVLVLKKHLVNQIKAPARSGGGTVFYVTNGHHRFLSNRIERYEGGTPNIVGIVRTGLAFLLKRHIQHQYNKARQQQQQSLDGNNKNGTSKALPASVLEFDYQTHETVKKRLQRTAPNLVLLDQQQSDAHHLPIFSFLIRCGKRFLHFNYVCAILNDVFGIQSRGGCQCAGPYSQRLLGLTNVDDDDKPNQRNQQVEHALVHYKERAELLRPGYTRLSLPFKGVRTEEAEYVLKALEWVAKNGWALMCHYRCNHRTGEVSVWTKWSFLSPCCCFVIFPNTQCNVVNVQWRHSSRQGKPLGRTERKWLSHFDPRTSSSLSSSHKRPNGAADNGGTLSVQSVLNEVLANADLLLEDARKDQRSIMQAIKMSETATGLDQDDSILEELRWYVHPKDCGEWLSKGIVVPPDTDAPQVLGALSPRLVDASIGAKESDSSGPSRKRKTTETTRVDNVDGEKVKEDNDNDDDDDDDGNDDNDDDPDRLNGDDMIAFKEGEHHGEAPLQDIEAGFEDGELSEQCVVFDLHGDTWMPIKEFLGRRKKARTESTPTARETIKKAVDDDDDDEKPMSFSETKDLKNQMKKPQRDSSAWGQSSYVPVSTTTALSHSVKNKEQASETNGGGGKRGKRGRGIKPPGKLMRLVTQAIMQWNMIEEGDRLLLGLSGGKDSLSLMHCLLELKRKLPINFDLEICTIDPMTPSFDPSPLIPYVESFGLKVRYCSCRGCLSRVNMERFTHTSAFLLLQYHYIKDDIVARASSSGKDGKVVSSLCAFCARMKRGNLYGCARRNKCNKLVLAQHLDDCAESFLMSVMHNGFLRTMKANYKVNAGDISVIRPMVYCRESLMTDFAKSANLPIINENCPACFEEPKERARMKKLLSREETLYPTFYDNIRRSILPLMHEDATAILRCYTEETVAKSRKENHKRYYGRNKKRQAPVDDEETRAAKKEQQEAAEAKRQKTLLATATDDDLLKELARRKASQFRLSGSMGRLGQNDDDEADPTGQVCTLNGGNGSIPCRELME